jgi:hypothetical protein
MNLKNLKSIFINNGCSKVYVKILSPNDNSKNQVYLGGSFDILNILPISNITSDNIDEGNSEIFKAKIDFSWISEEGELFPAPKSQLILYPQYPEVRFSGFLSKCKNAPSVLMTQRLSGRVLFFSVANNGNVIGYVCSPESEIANEFNAYSKIIEYGVFKVIELPILLNNKAKLIGELSRIYRLDWIKSKRINGIGEVLPCESSNCGGYTLEAELGIRPNGFSEPDYLGWEIKQFGVSNFAKINSAVITLMTPEPTNGVYKDQGAEFFIRNYGYPDKNGKEDRLNFGGIHKVGSENLTTNLELKIIGYDFETGKIKNTNGSISLIDKSGVDAASWSFSSLLLHWNKKHNQACYIPSLSDGGMNRKYKYGSQILLGTGTDFQLFINQLASGNIFYDPGIKMENESSNPKIKKRSQFRIKSGNLSSLYHINEIVDLEL